MVKGEGFPGNGNVGSKFPSGSLVYNMLEFTIRYVMDILTVLILVAPFR